MTHLSSLLFAGSISNRDWSIAGTAVLVLACVAAGAFLQRKGIARTGFKLARLARLKSKSVRLADDGRECFEDVTTLEPGNIFVVRAGERFPTDGIVEEGNSQVDESLLNGDRTPRRKEPGEVVFAGTLNLEESLHVRATHSSHESTLSRTIAVLQQAFASRLHFERWVDYANRVFFPAMLILAGLIFFLSWSSGLASFREALWRGIALALVAYPLSLRLATRPVVNAALWAASREGILIRDANVLETLDHANHFVLDKTGTVTEGNFELLGCELVPDYCSSPAWMQANAANLDLDGLPSDFPFAVGAPSYEQTFELLGSVEQQSSHPLGIALVNFACERGIPLAEATCSEVHKGLGVTGIVDGRSIFIGGRRLVEGLCVFVDARTELVARRWESEGRTVAFFGWDGALRGCLAFGDKPRPHAPELIAGLKRSGIRVHLLSGDSYATTEAIARQLGAESCRSDLLPYDKAELVRCLRKRGAVVGAVGHAIDDELALAAADVGIAIGCASDWGARTPSTILLNEDLTSLSKLVALARRTMGTVRQNLIWAAGCTALGVVLAIYGLLNPPLAALFALTSALGVVGNSMRLEAAIRAR